MRQSGLRSADEKLAVACLTRQAQFVTAAGGLLVVPFGVALMLGAPVLALRGRLRSGLTAGVAPFVFLSLFFSFHCICFFLPLQQAAVYASLAAKKLLYTAAVVAATSCLYTAAVGLDLLQHAAVYSCYCVYTAATAYILLLIYLLLAAYCLVNRCICFHMP